MYSCVLKLYSVHQVECYNSTSRCRAEQGGEVSPLTTHSHPIFPHGLGRRAIQLAESPASHLSFQWAGPNQKTLVSPFSKHLFISCIGRSQEPCHSSFWWVGHQKTFNSRFRRMAQGTWPSFPNNSLALLLYLQNTNYEPF